MKHWYNRYLQIYGKNFDETAYADIITQVRQNLKKLQSDHPVVTVSVIAYNEEKHLLACLWSLSEMKTRYPIEIIGVDNGSQDRTADIYRAVGVPCYTETRHSPGYARSCGLLQARGKYFVNIDSDTLYPSTYADAMVDVMEKNPRVVGVSGTWSYYPDKHHSRMGIFFYTFFRDCYLWLQSFKRPELSVRGMVFVHRTEEARKVGIRTHIIRGEDGALAFGLRQYGKLAFRRDARVRAVTGYGTVGSGSLAGSFWVRVRQSLGNLNHLYTSATEYKDRESNLIKHE
ncbi:glycosyltransferase family A protein [Parabacteroides sp. ZJ-118]|uniref:glycosyltransferase family A protein n=1 Tax=Parabacteroides sp. ZJ-118 TaxID=2709398 RepID=UPI0013E9ABA3|nr:glycosyltransferase family 2 protein [Parabacteroides sp. ZJ-118]